MIRYLRFIQIKSKITEILLIIINLELLHEYITNNQKSH